MNNDNSIDWPTLTPLCEEAASRHGVSPDLHPLDFIFRFIFESPSLHNDRDRVGYYFDDGARSAQQLGQLISEICSLSHSAVRLLEFASGYGCVTRHLRSALSGASVTSCDIHGEAVEFLERTLGVHCILSDTAPEALELSQDYNVIFALSFFSHMPKGSWGRWLNTLSSGLRPGGYLIFTTHGYRSGELHLGSPQLDSDGFWFHPASEQKDLETSDYGTTLTAPSFVGARIDENSELRLVHSAEGFWWQHQDLYVLRRVRI